MAWFFGEAVVKIGSQPDALANWIAAEPTEDAPPQMRIAPGVPGAQGKGRCRWL